MKPSILFLVLFVATVPVYGEGVQYSDPDLHYSIKFPEGWRRLSSETQTRGAAEFALQTGQTFPKFEAWFQKSNKPDGDYPYLLISRHICRMPTLENLAANIKEIARPVAKKTNNDLKGVVNTSKFADPVIHTRRNMVLIETEQTVFLGGIGKVKSTTCLFPGKSGVAQLHFYCTAADVDRSKADFDFMLDTFTFEPSYDYQSGLDADSPSPMINFDRVLMFGLIGGIFGPLIYSLLKRINPNYPPALQWLRVVFVLLIVLGGLESLIDTPSGPIGLIFILGSIIIGFSGLVILWSRGMKVSSNSIGERTTDVPTLP